MMFYTHRTRRSLWAGTVLIAQLSAGCVMLPDYESDSLPDPRLVATNLVYTLAQLPELHPMRTTVQMREPITPFGKEVLDRLEQAGYGVQTVTTEQGAHYVGYRTSHNANENGARTRFELSIGPARVERDYRLVDGRTVPDSTVGIDGTSVLDLTLNDGIFARGDVEPSFSRVAERDATAPVRVAFATDPVEVAKPPPTASQPATSPASAPPPQESTASVPESAEPLVPVTVVASAGDEVPEVAERASPEPPVSVRAPKQNMFELGGSNYAGLFANYDDVRSDTLVFGNDSLRLGDANKKIIASYVEALNPETDVLSIIGCSHGKSTIANGNELLSIGRANRVKEAFVYAGVPYDVALEESCWASGYHRTLPKRGVVISLKRARA